MQYVNEIACESLAWEHLGPLVQKHRELILTTVERDTRKLSSTEAFLTATAPDAVKSNAQPEDDRRGGESLRAFSDARTRYLLNYKEAPTSDVNVSRPPRREREE